MRTISLWQPWASALFVPGLKSIETRHWHTPYRGPLLIHAAKKQSREIAHLFSQKLTDDRNTEAMVKARIDSYLALPFGALIGTVDLVDCIATAPFGWNRTLANAAKFEPFCAPGMWPVVETWGDFSPERFGWCFTNPKLLPAPIPYKGAQGFFNAEVTT